MFIHNTWHCYNTQQTLFINPVWHLEFEIAGRQIYTICYFAIVKRIHDLRQQFKPYRDTCRDSLDAMLRQCNWLAMRRPDSSALIEVVLVSIGSL